MKCFRGRPRGRFTGNGGQEGEDDKMGGRLATNFGIILGDAVDTGTEREEPGDELASILATLRGRPRLRFSIGEDRLEIEESETEEDDEGGTVAIATAAVAVTEELALAVNLVAAASPAQSSVIDLFSDGDSDNRDSDFKATFSVSTPTLDLRSADNLPLTPAS